MNNSEYVQNLIEAIEELIFDSIILIFGISEGEYLQELDKHICRENAVFIIEPDIERYDRLKDTIDFNKFILLPYEDELVENILKSLINFRNFNRLRVHAYGDYDKEYEEEYNNFIRYIDNAYFTALSDLNVAYTFKSLFLKNLISNIKKIDKSTSINSCIDINKNIPSIIVSAGPSLDKNIQIMLENKEILNKFFIIAGNRTLGSLLKNGIIPNLVISIDPQDVTYEMIEKYIESKIPLAFYELSNKELINAYEGELIYIAQLLPMLVDELKEYKGLFIGGSVAHSCTDFARLMGCNPIIFVGQDLAYTFDKHHSDISSFEIDNNENISDYYLVNDIYGNEIKTTFILNYYKMKFEEYIKEVKKNQCIDFFNASYGADIEGAPHMELEEIFKLYGNNEGIQPLLPNKSIQINSDTITKSIFKDIENFNNKFRICIDICKELESKDINIPMIEMKENNEDLQKFIYAFQTVEEFENSKLALYIGGYVKTFMYEIRETQFNMMSKDYSKLTSDIKYQSYNLYKYFTKLEDIFKEIKDLLENQ